MQPHGMGPGRARLLVVLALALMAAPAAAQQHWVRSGKAMARDGKPARTPSNRLPLRIAPQQPVSSPVAQTETEPAFGASRSEGEPNDSPTAANAVTVGDTVNATINPDNDVDYYALQLTAGALVEFDVDAHQFGSPLDPYMAVFAPDGTMLALRYNSDGYDPRIRITAAVTGRYVVGVASEYGSGPNYTYRLRIVDIPPPPGDPTSIFATGLGAPWGFASDSGNLYVADRVGSRLLRVSATGAVSQVAAMPMVPLDVVVDGYGDLLVVGYDSLTYASTVRRVTKSGTVTPFISGLGFSPAITLGPDGDVWVADTDSVKLRRYDSQGILKNTASLGNAYGALDLAFSPSGVLHLSDWDGSIYKLAGTTLQAVLNYVDAAGLAFDRDGYLYVSSYYRTEVSLYGPSYAVVTSPFALGNLNGPFNIGFARNADGTMSSRLYAMNAGSGPTTSPGTAVLLNVSGIRAPGHRIGTDLLRLSKSNLRAGVMGESYADTLAVIGEASGVTWSVASGTLPPGVTLSATTGVLSGVLRAPGTFTFSIQASAGGRIGARSFTVTVTEPMVVIAVAANHLLGATGQLTPDLERYLDLQGNANNRFDIGDLRAYLRKRGELTSSANPMARKEVTP